MADEPTTQADEATRRAIAADAAVGVPASHIAELYGYAAGSIRAMLSTDAMETMIAAERGRIALRRQIARLKAAAASPDVMDRMIAKSLDDEHKDAMAAGRLVLDMAELGNVQQVNINHSVDSGTLAEINASLGSLRGVVDVSSRSEPELVHGTDVVPTPERIAELDAELRGLTDAPPEPRGDTPPGVPVASARRNGSDEPHE